MKAVIDTPIQNRTGFSVLSAPAPPPPIDPVLKAIKSRMPHRMTSNSASSFRSMRQSYRVQRRPQWVESCHCNYRLAAAPCATMKMPPATGASIDLQSSLEDLILRCEDPNALRELLYKQATVATPSARLDAHLRKLIDEPVPHLTAAAFRVHRYTGSTDLTLHEAAASYLTLQSYDGDWYDETINSIGWANELLAEGSQSPLVSAYQKLVAEAGDQGHDELLEFCRSYSR